MGQNSDIIKSTSLDFEIIKTLSKKYNFKPDYIDMNQVFGKFVNGTWIGSIGAVVNNVTLLKC